LFVDREGVGAVKRETNMNPNQGQVLSMCMLLSHVHNAILLHTHNIGECDEQNILKLELALFHLRYNASENN
jgi:hypothetical protein